MFMTRITRLRLCILGVRVKAIVRLHLIYLLLVLLHIDRHRLLFAIIIDCRGHF